MVREYDNIYNGFLDALSELERIKERSKGTNEKSLLDRISKLEIERDEKNRKFTQIQEDKKNLTKRLEGMEELKKEYDYVNHKVEETNMLNQENLQREVKRLNQELDFIKNEKTQIDQENIRLAETLAKSEIEYTRAEKERRDEKEKLNQKQQSLEDMVNEYELKIK